MMFSDEEKQKAFDMIETYYFHKNFGSMPKSDLETLMFLIYYNHKKAKDGNIDDYSIGRDLALTETRVRALKERIYLKYPDQVYENDWKDVFVNCMQYAVYDNDYIKFSIPDVNVFKEVRYFLEINHWYDEYHLNVKVFQCKLEIFFKICEKLNEEGTLEADNKMLDELKKKYSTPEQESIIEMFRKKEWKKASLELAKIAGDEFLNAIIDCIPFSNISTRLFKATFDTVKRSIQKRSV